MLSTRPSRRNPRSKSGENIPKENQSANQNRFRALVEEHNLENEIEIVNNAPKLDPFKTGRSNVKSTPKSRSMETKPESLWETKLGKVLILIVGGPTQAHRTPLPPVFGEFMRFAAK